MADPAKPDPSAPSGERRTMDTAWTLISDVLAGIDAVRGRGQAYLPKYQDESQSEYDRRKSCAPWRPEFADALQALVSKPFAKDVGLVGDVSDRIKSFAEDIDGRGNSQTRFSAETFEGAVAKGVHLILVDFPAMEPGATVAAERAANARPYWVQVRGDDIVALYTSWQGGKEVIDHLRFRETVTARDGFGETVTSRVRVYEPGRWEVWEQDPTTKDWASTDSGVIARGPSKASSVPAVLLVTGERLGELRVRPPLEQLAHLQIELYQALSRLDEILTYASAPMLTANGMGKPEGGGNLTVGPKSVLYAPPGDQPTSWAYISPDASNVAQIRQHVASIIDDMRRLGMQPRTQQTGSRTATGESIEAAKAHAAVKAWAMHLKDALEQAWVFTCEWVGEPTTVQVSISTDFDVQPFAPAPLQALATARAAKDISQRTLWEALQRFDVLPQDFDPDEEEEALAEEQQGLEPEEQFDPVSGRPLDGDDGEGEGADEATDDEVGAVTDDDLGGLFSVDMLGDAA